MSGNWSDIIRAAATGDLGVLALIVLVLGAVALVYFRNGPTFAQMFVFLALFSATVMFGAAILQQRDARAAIPSGKNNARADKRQDTPPLSAGGSAQRIDAGKISDRQPRNAVAATAAPEKRTVFIATGPASGVYYPIGTGIAGLLNNHMPHTSAAAGITVGSVANIQMLQSGSAQIAVCIADTVWDAYKGQRKFLEKPATVRALMVLYPNRMHVVTVEGSGIERFTDLKGKRVSTGPRDSETELIARRLLEAHGMSLSDIVRERLDSGRAAEAIRNRKLDAFFSLNASPSPSITDLATTHGIKVKLIDHDEVVDRMVERYGPIYVRDVIAAKSYPGQQQPSRAVAIWNILVARSDMPDELAYDIVKAMFEHKDELSRVHRDARNLDLRYQSRAAAGIPYHPGAARYFTEKGVKIE